MSAITSSTRSAASRMESPECESDRPSAEMMDTVRRATAAVAPPGTAPLGGHAAWNPAALCTGAAAASALQAERYWV